MPLDLFDMIWIQVKLCAVVNSLPVETFVLVREDEEILYRRRVVLGYTVIGKTALGLEPAYASNVFSASDEQARRHLAAPFNEVVQLIRGSWKSRSN